MHQTDVFFIAVIVVYCNVTIGRFKGLARNLGEHIPVSYAFAVKVPGALDLIGGASRAKEKIFWKSHNSSCCINGFIISETGRI